MSRYAGEYNRVASILNSLPPTPEDQGAVPSGRMKWSAELVQRLQRVVAGIDGGKMTKLLAEPTNTQMKQARLLSAYWLWAFKEFTLSNRREGLPFIPFEKVKTKWKNIHSTPMSSRYRAAVADEVRESFLADRQQVARVNTYRRGTGGGPHVPDVPQPDPYLLSQDEDLAGRFGLMEQGSGYFQSGPISVEVLQEVRSGEDNTQPLDNLTTGFDTPTERGPNPPLQAAPPTTRSASPLRQPAASSQVSFFNLTPPPSSPVAGPRGVQTSRRVDSPVPGPSGVQTSRRVVSLVPGPSELQTSIRGRSPDPVPGTSGLQTSRRSGSSVTSRPRTERRAPPTTNTSRAGPRAPVSPSSSRQILDQFLASNAEQRQDLVELRREREREGLLLVKEQRIREEGEFLARREMEERKEEREQRAAKRKAEMEEAEHNIKMKIYNKILSVLEDKDNTRPIHINNLPL